MRGKHPPTEPDSLPRTKKSATRKAAGKAMRGKHPPTEPDSVSRTKKSATRKAAALDPEYRKCSRLTAEGLINSSPFAERKLRPAQRKVRLMIDRLTPKRGKRASQRFNHKIRVKDGEREKIMSRKAIGFGLQLAIRFANGGSIRVARGELNFSLTGTASIWSETWSFVSGLFLDQATASRRMGRSHTGGLRAPANRSNIKVATKRRRSRASCAGCGWGGGPEYGWGSHQKRPTQRRNGASSVIVHLEQPCRRRSRRCPRPALVVDAVCRSVTSRASGGNAFNHLNPGSAFIPNWHIEAIAYHLELVRRGTIKRLIINVPLLEVPGNQMMSSVLSSRRSFWAMIRASGSSTSATAPSYR